MELDSDVPEAMEQKRRRAYNEAHRRNGARAISQRETQQMVVLGELTFCVLERLIIRTMLLSDINEFFPL